MKEIKRIFVQVFILVMPINILAQSSIDTLQQIGTAYLINDGLSFNVDYNYYKDSSSTIPYERLNGKVKYIGDLYYSKLNHVETIKNQDYYLMVDSKDKRIMLERNYKVSNSLHNIFDSSYLQYSSIKYSKLDREGIITLNFDKNNALNFVKIYYAQETYLINSIFIYYKRVTHENQSYNPMIHIKYSNYREGIDKSDPLFSETRFLAKESGTLVLKSAFIGYQFINNIAD